MARRGGWPSSATCPARPWCWAARSRRSWSAAARCGSGAWSWPGGAAGEEPSISGRGSSSGWTPGYRGTTRSGSLDVAAAAEWVGAWWTAALAGLGQHGFDVHTGRSVPGELGELVCFAGRGPGEVFHGATEGGGPLAVAGPGGRAVLVLRVPALGSRTAAGAGALRRSRARRAGARPGAAGRGPGRPRSAGRRDSGACGTSCWARSLPSRRRRRPTALRRRLGVARARPSPLRFVLSSSSLLPLSALLFVVSASSARARAGRERSAPARPRAVTSRREPPERSARRGAVAIPRGLPRPGAWRARRSGGEGWGLQLCCKGGVVVEWREMA